MKRFLCWLLTISAAVVLYVNKEKIADFASEIFSPGKYVDWEEISSQELSEGARYKCHFDSLSENGKKAYNNILTTLLSQTEEFPELIEVPSMSGDELTRVFEAVIYDNPTVMCIGKNNKIITDGDLCYFQPDYALTPSQQDEMNSRLDEKCDEILSLIPEGSDEFETVLFIHDYIINNCEYDTTLADSSSTAYSCLIDGVSACEGYSKAAKLIFEKAGLECYTVLGDAVNFSDDTEGHMWNIIEVDSEYYHLDITWDDPTSPDGEATLSHLYMNLTDEEISHDHFNFETGFVCDSTENNYFVRTGSLFDKFNSETRNEIVKLMGKCKTDHLELRFSSGSAYGEAVDYLIDRGNIYYLIRRSNNEYGTSYGTESIRYIENQEKNLLELYFD